MESPGKVALWSGRILTLLAAAPFLASAAMKFSGGPQIVQGFEHFGWPATSIMLLAILELGSVVLYLIPPLSVLGAIVLTGYLGGALSTHLRLGEPVYLHIVIGIVIWLGLFLREPRLRVLIPVRGRDCVYQREIEIDRPRDVVFAYLRNLKNFENWNPYLKSDPGCSMEYRGVDGQPGMTAIWNGKKAGAGEQEITRLIENERVAFDLRFIRPFQNRTTGAFIVEASGQGKSKVIWWMDGKAVFPMTLFGLFMSPDKMMGGFFESGLKELKTLLEKR